MIALLRKIRRILRPNRLANIGKIRDSVSDVLSTWIGRLERFKEVILFIPVIYKTVRWDYSSIFIILEHWLGRMEDVQRNDKLHVNAKRHANEIKQCVLLLKRINTDYVEKMCYNVHDEKWGELHTWSTPCKKPGYYQWNSARPNVKTPEDMKQERYEYRKMTNHIEYLYKQDVEMLFSIIKKHHRGWWT